MSAFRRLMKPAAGLVDVFRRPPPGVTALVYHRVGARTSMAVDLPTRLFDEQMAWLAASGRLIGLDDAVDLLVDGGDSAPRIVVTFDDGTVDLVDEALPILERHGVPATFYVATDFVERQRAFPKDGRPITWAGLAECVSSGLVTVGSHTHTHALLDRLPDDEVVTELDRSIDLIGARLGVEARHFAYPKALAGSPAADRAVRSRFVSAAVAGTRPNPFRHTDLYALQRSPIQVSDGMTWFERKADGGMWAEDALRRAVNRRRYAGATT